MFRSQNFIILAVLLSFLVGCSEDISVSPNPHSIYGDRFEGDVRLVTQADVDAMAGVTVITGELIIRALSEIRNLNGLGSLTFVGSEIGRASCRERV